MGRGAAARGPEPAVDASALSSFIGVGSGGRKLRRRRCCEAVARVVGDALSAPWRRRRAFLVNHGSFNPVHQGHVRMMELARARLEAAGYDVEFGVLALTRPSRIRAKGAEPLPDDLRTRLIDRCLEGASAAWLRSDPRGVRFGCSGAMIEDLYGPAHPELLGFRVVGADTALRYGFAGATVVVARAGYELPCEDHRRLVFCAVGGEEEATSSFSSTAVREALAAADRARVARMCGPAAAAELLAAACGDQPRDGSAP